MTKSKGTEGIYQRGKVFWVKVYENGKPVQRSAKTSDIKEAIRFRDQLRAQAGRGELARDMRVKDILIEELMRDDIARMMTKCGTSTVRWSEQRWNLHLLPYFGKLSAVDLTTDMLQAYQLMRVKAGAEKATINNEMALLRTALYTGYRRTPQKVVTRPMAFPMFSKSLLTVRTGFIDLANYEKLVSLVEPSLKTLVVVLYHLGLRKGEAINLKWDQIEFPTQASPIGLIRLKPLETKNHEARTCPMYGDLEAYLRWQREIMQQLCPTQPYVFCWMPGSYVARGQDGGSRILPGTPMGGEGRHFKATKSWRDAVAEIGYPGLVMHDMRRSAVRNMIEVAGMSVKQAMVFSGHKTVSMIERYHILGRGEIESAHEKLQKMFDNHKGTRPAPAVGRPMELPAPEVAEVKEIKPLPPPPTRKVINFGDAVAERRKANVESQAG